MIAHGTAEWYDARCGNVSASRVYEVVARQKNGKHYKARADYLLELVTEQLTGQCVSHYVTPAMQWGIDHEADAIAAFEWVRNVRVEPVGWIEHPTIPGAGATPDGKFGRTLIELKCPTTAVHLQALMGHESDPAYVMQMAWQLACDPTAEGAEFISYDPRLPPDLQLTACHRSRDEQPIKLIEAEVCAFLDELNETVAKLRNIETVSSAA